MFNKLLIGFFAILLIVVVGEAGYLFLYAPAKNSKTISDVPVITPTVRDPNANFNGNPSSSRIAFWGPIMTSSIAINEYEGVVVVVDTNPGQIEDNTDKQASIKYAELVGLEPNLGKGVARNFYIRQQDLPITKVYRDSLGVKTEMKFSELKVGDTIKIKEVINIMAPLYSNRISVDIDKIK